MTIRQHMDNYLNMHIKSFKKSFKLNNPISQLLLELGKYFSLLVLLFLFLYIIVRFFISVLPLLTSIDKLHSVDDFINNPSLISTIMQQSTLLSAFLIKTIILLLLTALFLSFILAIFNSLIVAKISNSKWYFKKFIKIIFTIF